MVEQAIPQHNQIIVEKVSTEKFQRGHQDQELLLHWPISICHISITPKKIISLT